MLTEKYPDAQMDEAIHSNWPTCPDALRCPSNYRQGAAEDT